MKNIFNSVKKERLPRSTFDLSHRSILTPSFGYLTPINVEELIAGDKVTLNTEHLIRCMPLKSPIFQSLKVKVRHFAVPHRILSQHFNDFMQQNYEVDGLDLPYTTMYDIYKSGHMGPNLIPDYFGVPFPQSNRETDPDMTEWDEDTPVGKTPVRLLPFMAYAAIYRDWYCDANLDSVLYEKYCDIMEKLSRYKGRVYYTSTLTDKDGNNVNILDFLFNLNYVLRSKDYFTSALLSQQRGNSVRLLDSDTVRITASRDSEYTPAGGFAPLWNAKKETDTFVESDDYSTPNDVVLEGKIDNPSIIELRTLEAAQKFLERANLGGRRYPEFINAIFGTHLSPSLTDRAQYIGGSKSTFNISEVLNTSSPQSTEATAILGDYSGRAVSGNSTKFFGYYAKEPCFLISVMTIVPDRYYMFGLPKMLQRLSPYEMALPQFARIGEQEIKSNEYAFNFDKDGDPDSIFGYTPRYADWKTHVNEAHGLFKTPIAEHWHCSPITLYSQQTDFKVNYDEVVNVRVGNPDRVFALEDSLTSPAFYAMFQINMKKSTSLPYYGEAKI